MRGCACISLFHSLTHILLSLSPPPACSVSVMEMPPTSSLMDRVVRLSRALSSACRPSSSIGLPCSLKRRSISVTCDSNLCPMQQVRISKERQRAADHQKAIKTGRWREGGKAQGYFAAPVAKSPCSPTGQCLASAGLPNAPPLATKSQHRSNSFEQRM